VTGTRRLARAGLAALGIIVIAGLLALGTWQVQRRAWKLDLIARVEAGLRAPPVPPPATAGRDDAYRRVVTSGTWLAGNDSLVQASTIRGPGWWVMTPLQAEDGRTILVNRGYVSGHITPPVPPGRVTVTGLLRLTEPGGGFLRRNDPAAGRWFSRDVSVIADQHRLNHVAPYFIDADSRGNRAGQPVGGLTVVAFANNHLVYAITWYMLAAMTLAALLYWLRAAR